MMKSPEVSADFTEMRNEVRSEKGEEQMQDETSEEAETRSTENREGPKSGLGGVDLTGLTNVGVQLAETVAKNYQSLGVDQFVKGDSKVFKETNPENFRSNP